MLNSFLKHFEYQSWQLQNEKIIAIGLLLFSMTILVAYQGVVFSISDGHVDTSVTCYSLIAYPIFCVLRLIALGSIGAHRYFAALTGVMDVLLLSFIIFMFSVQYESVAATLKSPSFVFYFVLIALHGMRFKPRLTLLNGGCSIAAWALFVITLQSQSENLTNSYLEYATSSATMTGTELEKILALTVFTFIMAFASKRVNRLHEQEKVAQQKLFIQDKEAQRILHQTEQEARARLSQVTLQEEKRISRNQINI